MIWEVGVSALLAIGSTIYDRFVGIRGLSADFENDLDKKLKYFTDVVREIETASIDAIAQFDDLERATRSEDEKAILREIVHIYEKMTRREAGMAALKDTDFFRENRGQIKKLKKKDREFLLTFYEQFETLAARTTRNCLDIDRHCVEAKSGLDSPRNSTQQTREAIYQITCIVSEIGDDYLEFSEAMMEATGEE